MVCTHLILYCCSNFGKLRYLGTASRLPLQVKEMALKPFIYIIFLIFVITCIANDAVKVDALYTVVRSPIYSTGPEAALISVPGAFITGEAYEPLCIAIQEATPMKLWVGLTAGYPSDFPNPIDVDSAITLAINDLQAAGMSSDARIFVGAHSVGGIFSQTVVAENPDRYAGLLLWASYLSPPTADLGAFPTSVLTVSGDLDGMTRMTRIGRTFRALKTLVRSDPTAVYTKPVVLASGVNHAHFASGKMPPNVVENDIPSNLPLYEAHRHIAKICSLFLVVTTESSAIDLKSEKKLLNEYVLQTDTTFSPLFEAQNLEALGETCNWAVQAQEMVASIPGKYEDIFNVTNLIYPGELDFIRSKPYVTRDGHGYVLASTAANIELPDNPEDRSLIEESANQIAVKTKNQKAVQRVLGNGTYGRMKTCQGINKESLSWAFERASPKARDRYTTRGREMYFDKDIVFRNGFKWPSAPLDYNYTDDGNIVVTSPSLYTDPDYMVPRLAGMFYCKLLSPYRAMEWIYVDSLRPYNQ